MLPSEQQLEREMDFLEGKQRLRVRFTSAEAINEVPEPLLKKGNFRIAHTGFGANIYVTSRLCIPSLRLFTTGNVSARMDASNVENSVDHFALRCPEEESFHPFEKGKASTSKQEQEHGERSCWSLWREMGCS